jgi:hypothetical protein
VGRIYQSALEKYGTLVAREKLWRRIVRIYSYHLLLLGFAFSICAAIAAVLFVCRHTAFNVLIGPTLFDALVNQWRLGILRQIDAAAIGILLVKYGSPLAETWLGRRLATLGRASLEVFCTHLVFCFFFLGLASAIHLASRRRHHRTYSHRVVRCDSLYATTPLLPDVNWSHGAANVDGYRIRRIGPNRDLKVHLRDASH